MSKDITAAFGLGTIAPGTLSESEQPEVPSQVDPTPPERDIPQTLLEIEERLTRLEVALQKVCGNLNIRID